mgnify:CR=1 FL=1
MARKALYKIDESIVETAKGVFETAPPGKVVNTILLEDGANWQPPDGYAVVDAETGGGVGDFWDGNQLTVPIKPTPKAWWQK